ncbi:hypothetical protein BH11CYA1_BH11CYA1_18120 [soil metagenome]
MIASLANFWIPSAGLAQEDFTTHPVLGTRVGDSFAKPLSDSQLEQLYCKPFDSNYCQHEKAERDAAETFCRSLESGQQFKIIGKHHQRQEHFTFGFNQIPVSLNFEKGRCIRARIAGVSEFPQSSELSGVENAGRIVHPILDVAENEPFSSPTLTNWQMKQLCKDFSYTSHHMEEARMFARAELQAAQLFQRQLTGLTMKEVTEKTGQPYFTTTMGQIFGDTTNGAQNWVYYLGFASIPVRLLFKNGVAQTSFLSRKQTDDFRKLNMCLFSRTPEEKPDEELLPFYHSKFRPRGMTKTAIIAIYGEPYLREKPSNGNEIFHYRLGDGYAGKLTFDGEQCIESTVLISFGYRSKRNID